jgi:HEPN domain-containing protein
LAQHPPASPPAAEKVLKGTLLELGQEPPHTPVLNDLVGNLSAQGVEVAVIAFLEQLDRPGA